MNDNWQNTLSVLKQRFGDKVQENYPFSKLTTLEIGGPIKAFIEVTTVDELTAVLNFAQEHNLPFLVIGGGSNLLVSDEPVEMLVIKNSITGVTDNGDGTLAVAAGTNLGTLVDFTIEHGLDGMSTMKGIPGSVGGAIYGSAGAYGDNIRDHLLSVTYLDHGQVKTLRKDEFTTGYRDSFFKKDKNLIIISAVFGDFGQADSEHLKAESEQILIKRTDKYPPNTKCPGSFFKNVIATDIDSEVLKKIPQEKIMYGKIPAGYLLESVGAKEDFLGAIRIASNHANTFFNTGNGTAKDFYALAKKYQQKVKDEYGILLEPEVQFVNLPALEA